VFAQVHAAAVLERNRSGLRQLPGRWDALASAQFDKGVIEDHFGRQFEL
jgi:hypothetical protein